MKAYIEPSDLAIGQIIRQSRTERGLSLEELGRRIGVTYQQVQKYETGSNRVSGSRIIMIANAMDMEPHQFLPAASRSSDAELPYDVMQFARKLAKLPVEQRVALFAGFSPLLPSG